MYMWLFLLQQQINCSDNQILIAQTQSASRTQCLYLLIKISHSHTTFALDYLFVTYS
jgi:hypothetical protein